MDITIIVKLFTLCVGCILEDGFSYAGDTNPEEMLSDESDKITPPENQDFNTELSFFQPVIFFR